MRGETRRKARRCIRRRSIAARIAVKTTGAAVQGAGVRPRPRAPRRTPEGAKRGHGSGRSGTDRSRGRRVAQDSTPTAYMYTPSGSEDAQIARPAQGVPLPEPWPHIDRQTKTARLLIHKLCQVPIIKRQRVAPGEGRGYQRWCRRWGWSGSRCHHCRTRRSSEPSKARDRCRAAYAPRRSGRSARRCC